MSFLTPTCARQKVVAFSTDAISLLRKPCNVTLTKRVHTMESEKGKMKSNSWIVLRWNITIFEQLKKRKSKTLKIQVFDSEISALTGVYRSDIHSSPPSVIWMNPHDILFGILLRCFELQVIGIFLLLFLLFLAGDDLQKRSPKGAVHIKPYKSHGSVLLSDRVWWQSCTYQMWNTKTIIIPKTLV